ncbi:MAG: AAA family ATPase [Egibacteraceae bacterium]
MRIAFVGKGGSGKTTLSSLFARHLHAQGLPVLAIDADINQHLAVALGMDEAEAARLPAMGSDLAFVKDCLRGRNPRIASAAATTKTTPPGSGSRLLRLAEDNPIYTRFERTAGGVRLLATGPFDDADLGVACYHSKTAAVELLLSHLIDGPGEYVVVDMTAGADSFASGLFTRFDLTVLVAEPTARAVGVCRQYQRYAAGFDLAIAVVGNKAVDGEDRAFLRRELGADLLACLGRSDYVRTVERGDVWPISQLEAANRQALERLRAAVDAIDKDWAAFHRQTVEFHIRNARVWGNAAAGLLGQIDPTFVISPLCLSDPQPRRLLCP